MIRIALAEDHALLREGVAGLIEREDDLTWKSVRNLTEVHALVPDQLNTYDVLCADDIVFTQGALEAFVAGPARGKGATAVGTATDEEVASL